jgi:hypothetical protein
VIEVVPLKLSCTRHHSIVLDDGRCLCCGREVDPRPVTVAYRLAKMDQADLRMEKHRWVTHPFGQSYEGMFSQTRERAA